jgi:hypothetical protein
MDKTSRIKQFIFNAGHSIVSVEFIKADGSVRKKPNIVRCRDFSIARKEGEGAWRSFDCERVTSIKANGQTLVF